MTERLLQFIWQFQYFSPGGLNSTMDEHIQIVHPGHFNFHQGPDFVNARIRISGTVWAGHVELHLRTSDWNKHAHQDDTHYRNVILHVVWEEDCRVNNIPVLELKDRISNILVDKYNELLLSKGFIPCENNFANVPALTLSAWTDSLALHRLERKSKMVREKLRLNDFHWEETFWWLLARNFGMQVNAESFELMARSIPLSILAKHKAQIHQLEGLLLGQAGLLEEKFSEDYPNMLQKEYRFYAKLYKLKSIHEKPLFLRMRPSNFPSLRLAQLAMLVHDSVHLFSRIKEAESLRLVRKWFDITANDYWHYHYRFDDVSAFKKKNLGQSMIDNIIINTICPALFTYGDYHNEQKFKNKAIQWLEETTAEVNTVTAGFEKLGVKIRSAFDSQALLELKNEFCNHRHCLDCAVGCSILNLE